MELDSFELQKLNITNRSPVFDAFIREGTPADLTLTRYERDFFAPSQIPRQADLSTNGNVLLPCECIINKVFKFLNATGCSRLRMRGGSDFRHIKSGSILQKKSFSYEEKMPCVCLILSFCAKSELH